MWGGGAGYKLHKTIEAFLRRSDIYYLVVKFYSWK